MDPILLDGAKEAGTPGDRCVEGLDIAIVLGENLLR